MTFDENPYRRNAFDAFPLEKSETAIKAIRRVTTKAHNDLKDQKGRLLARDGTEWELTEAQLNGLEEALLDPLRRLQTEQFVHQEHLFMRNSEMSALIAELAAELREATVSTAILDDLGNDVIGELGRVLHGPAPESLADDLPWPEPPAALKVSLEPLEQTILRER